MASALAYSQGLASRLGVFRRTLGSRGDGALVRGKRHYVAQVIANPVSVRALKPLFRGPSLLCINYHRVASAVDHDRDLIAATPEQLYAQALWLKEHYRVLDGAEIEQFAVGRLALREPAVCVTFDDGYSDNFAAGKMLARLGVPATFFITTGFIQTGVIPPWDRFGYALRHSTRPLVDVPGFGGENLRLDPDQYDSAMTMLMDRYRLLNGAMREDFQAAVEQACGARACPASGENLFLTWAQIRHLVELGHTIGAHTHTHPVLASLTLDEQRREIATGREILESQLKSPVGLFAYPFGKLGETFSAVTKDIVRELGFKAAFSFYGGCNHAGLMDAYDLKRIKVDPSITHKVFQARVLTRGAIGI